VPWVCGLIVPEDSLVRKKDAPGVIHKIQTQTKGYGPTVNHLKSLWTKKCSFKVDGSR
jgi:hypothetical protein